VEFEEMKNLKQKVVGLSGSLEKVTSIEPRHQHFHTT
jgi:hypothetical protein